VSVSFESTCCAPDAENHLYLHSCCLRRYLSFEDHRGGLQTVNVKTLKELCGTTDGSKRDLQLVFVSACYSRVTGQAFIDAGIPHVCCVNVEAKILDKAAISFQYAFTHALVEGYTIQEAFLRGKIRVASSTDGSSAESEKFLLLGPQGAGPDHHKVRLFKGVEKVNKWDMPRHMDSTIHHDLPPSIPVNRKSFLGRNIEMYNTLGGLLENRLVTICGPPGCGKTAISIAISHYIWERRRMYIHFRDGVHIVRLSGHCTTQQVVESIVRTLREAHTLEKGRRQSGNYSPGASGYRKTPMHHSTRRAIASSEHGSSAADRRVPQEHHRKEDLFMEMRDRKMLFVFDDCDDLVDQGMENFQKFLQELLSTTRSVKVLLILRRGDFRVMGYPNPTVELGPLSFTSSILVLMKLCPTPPNTWRETFEALQQNSVLRELRPFLPNEIELMANTLHSRALCPLGLQGLLNSNGQDRPVTGFAHYGSNRGSTEAMAVFKAVRNLRGKVASSQNGSAQQTALEILRGDTGVGLLPSSTSTLPWEQPAPASDEVNVPMPAIDMSWALPPSTFAVGASQNGESEHIAAEGSASKAPRAGGVEAVPSGADAGAGSPAPATRLPAKMSSVEQGGNILRTPSKTQHSSGKSALTPSPTTPACWAQARLRFVTDTIKPAVLTKLNRFLRQRGVQCVLEPDSCSSEKEQESSPGVESSVLPVVIVALVSSQKHDFSVWKDAGSSPKGADGQHLMKGTIALQMAADLSMGEAPESLMLISAYRRKSSAWMNQLIGEITRLVYSADESSSESDYESS